MVAVGLAGLVLGVTAALTIPAAGNGPTMASPDRGDAFVFAVRDWSISADFWTSTDANTDAEVLALGLESCRLLSEGADRPGASSDLMARLGPRAIEARQEAEVIVDLAVNYLCEEYIEVEESPQVRA
jgi:hypothetical protein